MTKRCASEKPGGAAKRACVDSAAEAGAAVDVQSAVEGLAQRLNEARRASLSLAAHLDELSSLAEALLSSVAQPKKESAVSSQPVQTRWATGLSSSGGPLLAPAQAQAVVPLQAGPTHDEQHSAPAAQGVTPQKRRCTCKRGRSNKKIRHYGRWHCTWCGTLRLNGTVAWRCTPCGALVCVLCMRVDVDLRLHGVDVAAGAGGVVALPSQVQPPTPRMRQPGCHRADQRAKMVLERVNASGSKVADGDVLHVLETWQFERNVNRTNVMPDGVQVICSDHLGLLRMRVCHNWQAARKTRLFPHVTLLLTQFLKDNPPLGQPAGSSFPFTTICVNKNYAARRHRDKGNVGLSVVRALGSFSGGQLRQWPRDDRLQDLGNLRDRDSTLLNVQGQSHVVDSTCAHEVEDFQGTRYSLVYFTPNSYEKTGRGVRNEMVKKYGICIVPWVYAQQLWKPFPVEQPWTCARSS